MNAAGISRVLGKTYRRSETNATRIRGWHTTHEGFEVKQSGQQVTVYHIPGDWDKTQGEERLAKRTSMLAGYAAQLTRAGYSLTLTAGYITVTGKAA